jgi:hypothetical protein
LPRCRCRSDSNGGKHGQRQRIRRDAEFWDSLRTIIGSVKMATAVTGTRPDLGNYRKLAIQMGIDPQEDPPIKPGQPTEPPREDPPGNPRPEIPPPMQDPGEPSQPQELPGSMPDELPVRGPSGPQAPATNAAGTM